ncbi:hypothetical protein [Algoriphagus boritolerans]|uniref:Uncharacterized protein n=1 Tax=Algoriphagus boritolerans DSM 17298 = JCM 18970 TaxID=1120964 RepID=A0A1H5UZ40_9BACT|nr:hypothetical protein [Algoriphagus boritolerans]SEF80230.1 hypothetical protein SAMN03080598_01490 [Algoriphagus boritolerans DSM 17298 = JCM 18970]
MKKLPLLFFILLGCNIIPPEPSDFTIEEVRVIAEPNQSFQDSVGLLLVVRGIPPSNEWDMIWEVNGNVMFSEELDGKSGRISTLKKFKASQPGEYVFEGCIVSKTMRICDDETFYLK